MMKKVCTLVVALLLLCAASVKSVPVYAANEDSTQEDYSLTVISDEAVPLADGASESSFNYYVLYGGAAVIGIGAVYYMRKKAKNKKILEKQEQEVASVYMDDLIH